ncbi:hypothetical protein E1176_09615 [Fulvivirga sp. RKSG066]|uniref:hypothetical protein n=1 Tax=Fulvivirga aurantia TaxID=2529383 RepID=UPI0012BC2CDA|nr:hypothetical protein [Fulvivirga aurantia]MTI21277.1 hypothetical protein [Fulvivirga aurantia]
MNNTLTKKQALLQSLDSMNASEMDKVLGYVRDTIYKEANDSNYLNFKSKALKEIRTALKQGREPKFSA